MSTPTAGAMPPAPSLAQIPLPPGMTLEQFQALQKDLVSLAIIAAVVFGIMVWDYFNLLPDEMKLYQTSRKDFLRTPATWAFIVLRYAGIVATLPSLFFTSIQSNHCQIAVVISQVGVVLVVASSGIIFSYRVCAIWSGNRVVYAVVGFMYLIMLACWITVAAQYRAMNGPPTPFLSNCQILPIVTWAPICNASSVAFDAVILLLTISKLSANRAKSSAVGYLIYRDSLLYFLLTSVTNLTVLIIQTLGPSLNLVKAMVLPFSTLITATMGYRVFLNLKLVNSRQERANQGLPFSSTTSSNSRSKHPLPRATSPMPPQAYSIGLGSEGGGGHERPFAGYDTPKAPPSFEMAKITREVVITRE